MSLYPIPDPTTPSDLVTLLASLGITAVLGGATLGIASATTITHANGLTVRQAATQDAVALVGRAGGASSRSVSLTPASLGGNRTQTLQDATGTIALLEQAQTWTAAQTFTSTATWSSAGSSVVIEANKASFGNTANTSLFEFGMLGGSADANAYIYQRHNADLYIGTNNTTRIAVTAAGRVLIAGATDDTTSALQVQGVIRSSSLTSGRVPYITTNGALTDTSALTYNGSNNLTLGTGSPIFSMQATSGTSSTLRVGQTGVVNWDMVNTATTGVLTWGTPTVCMSLTSAGALTLPTATGTTLTVSSTSATSFSFAGGGTIGNGLIVSGNQVTAGAGFKVTGNPGAFTGSGPEFGFTGSRGLMTCYNRTGSAFLGFDFNALDFAFQISGATKLSLSSSAMTLASGVALVIPTTTPASASATGVAGTITWDASYLYVCTAANTWKRVAIATW